jgi:hypothetical protein
VANVARGGAHAVALLAIAAHAAAAQPEYRNIDGGRPLRVEDAQASARHSLDFMIAPLRLDRIAGGTYRWQVEPRLSYAAFPRTELKLRAPVAYREREADPRSGLVGVGLGAFHNLFAETERLPAFAVEGEVLVSASGSLTSGETYATRAIATRTLGRQRVHANAGYGTYRILTSLPNVPNVPPIPDVPCSMQPGQADSRGHEARASATCLAASPADMPHERIESGGSWWLAGAAVDRAFPLRSLVVAADVVVEHYRGLGRPLDWTAEVGVRRQLTPRTVVESMVGRRFLGVSRAWFVSLGVTTSRTARIFMRGTGQ